MSTDRADQTAQPHPNDMPGPEIAAFFRRVAASSDQPRLRGMKGAAQLVIQGAGTWRITVDDGKVTVTDEGRTDALPAADCVLTCTADDFIRIMHQEDHMNFAAAALQGRVIMSGNLPLAWMILGSYELEPRDPESASHRA